jgi:hypothetical protein
MTHKTKLEWRSGDTVTVHMLYKEYFKPSFVTKTLQLKTANVNNEG